MAKEEMKEYQKEYYKNHREERKEYDKEYQKEYRKNHKEKQKEYMKKYYKKNRKEMWSIHTLRNHKCRGYIINVDPFFVENLLKTTKECPYCGVTLEFGIKKFSSNSPSLDNINLENILTKDNIEIICHKCNVTKQNRTKKEFLDYCENITNRRKEIESSNIILEKSAPLIEK